MTENSSAMESGARAYHLHYELGQSWPEVEEVMGEPAERLRARARRYAKREGLPTTFTTGKSASQNSQPEERISDKFPSENERVLTSKTALIHTLDQLIEKCEVDLDTWMVKDHEVTAWPGWRKDKKTDMRWTDGKPDGFVEDSGGIVTHQLYRVFARLIRRDPIELQPVIKPVLFDGTMRTPKAPKNRPFVRHLIWGDSQIGFRRRVHDAKLKPFHDRRALDLVAQIAHAAQPDKMHITGDMFDCTEWTDKFLKSPEFYFTFQPALYEGAWWLRQYGELVPELLMHQGNHEKRLPDAVKRNLPFAYGLRPAHLDHINAPQILSFRFLLNLDKLGIMWIDDYPNDLYWLADKLALFHGNIARANPLNVAKALAKFDHSIINLHNHRNESSTQRRKNRHGPYTVWGYSVPCTCHIDWRVPGHTHNQHWSQGLIVVDVFDHKNFHIRPVPFEEGVAIWEGKMYQARSDVKQTLHKDLPKWNW